MEIEVIQTGSSGNCTIIDGFLALDMGVSIAKLAPYLPGLKLVFVGHAHGDHFKASTIRHIAAHRPGVRFIGGDWMIPRFRAAGVPLTQIDMIREGAVYNYGVCKVSPVSLIHDVPNYGLRVKIGSERLIYLVDTVSIDHIEARGYDHLLVEANYKTEEIMQRIADKQARGEFAYESNAMARHLSYEDAMAWIARQAGPNTEYMLLHEHVEKTDKRE